MKNLIALLFAALAAFSATAQNFEKKNSIIAETNVIASLSFSYDRIFPVSEKVAFMPGCDFMLGVGFGEGSQWLAPEANLMFFGPKHFLETGIMYALALGSEDSEEDSEGSSPGVRIAYRIQWTKGFTFRASANVFFNIDPVFLPEIGIGYAF